MATACLACRLDTWPLERHRIALITAPDERPLPKAWVWLCQRCVGRFRTGEPLGAVDVMLPTPRPQAATTDGVAPVSAREREIAALIAHGLSNREIAERLVLMSGTVANHVAHIMRKLGFNKRAEIAVWAVRAGLVSEAPDGRPAPSSGLGPAVSVRHGGDGTQQGPDRVERGLFADGVADAGPPRRFGPNVAGSDSP
jgi:DNA-binding CsgD family transcriptional regulator